MPTFPGRGWLMKHVVAVDTLRLKCLGYLVLGYALELIPVQQRVCYQLHCLSL